MIHDNCPAGVIITNGLGGDYSTYILAHFDLFIGIGVGSPITPPVIEITAEVIGRGVPHGLVDTQYDPRLDPRHRRREEEEPWEPRRDESEKEVVFKVRVGDREIERHYFRKDADRAIKAINFANKTKDQVNVTVDKIKNATEKVAVSFKGFRNNKD